MDTAEDTKAEGSKTEEEAEKLTPAEKKLKNFAKYYKVRCISDTVESQYLEIKSQILQSSKRLSE